MHGAVAICMVVGFISLVMAVCAVIDDFVKWHYRNLTIEIVAITLILYLIGCLIELVSET